MEHPRNLGPQRALMGQQHSGEKLMGGRGQARHGTRLVYMGHARVTAAQKEGSPHFEENKERGYARLLSASVCLCFYF